MLHKMTHQCVSCTTHHTPHTATKTGITTTVTTSNQTDPQPKVKSKRVQSSKYIEIVEIAHQPPAHQHRLLHITHHLTTLAQHHPKPPTNPNPHRHYSTIPSDPNHPLLGSSLHNSVEVIAILLSRRSVVDDHDCVRTT